MEGGKYVRGLVEQLPNSPHPAVKSVWCRVCDVECVMLSLWYPVWYPVCDVECVMSRVWYPVCDIQCVMSHVPEVSGHTTNDRFYFFEPKKGPFFKWQYRDGAGAKIMEKVEPELEHKLNNLGSATLPEFKLTNLWNLPKVLIKTSFFAQLKRDRCRTGAWI